MLSMREMGSMVHSSVKTFYFGVMSTFMTGLFFLFYEPAVFSWYEYEKGTYHFEINQVYGGIIIGLFAYSAQETLSLALCTVKSGAVAAFFNVGLIFSLLVDITYF